MVSPPKRLLLAFGTAASMLAAAMLFYGCKGSEPANPGPKKSSVDSAASRLRVEFSAPDKSRKNGVSYGQTRFVDITKNANLDFHYKNGAVGKALMVEATGGGVGWLDYDRDGRCDLYLVQGGNPAPQKGESLPTNRLRRNIDGTTFDDVSAFARVEHPGYGQGIAVGDFNNDGFDDFYVTNVGSNVLYLNLGDGTFENVTVAAGVDDRRWSSSAAWGDLDNDGDLDLFVCNYLKFDPYNPPHCRAEDGSPGTCHPHDLDAIDNVCFLNEGDGRFRSVAAKAGLLGKTADSKSLGVVIADLNNDGLQDVFIANDTTANFLFLNRGDFRFEEVAMINGCAMSGQGLYQASMGVALGDYDRNGFQDLYVTHFEGDSNTLYANYGATGFQDLTKGTAIHHPTLKELGFGTIMADFDQDGWQELFITNGHIDDYRAQGIPMKMHPQLFHYDGRRWSECKERAGSFFKKSFVGRGVAMADYDNDGDYDLAVIHQNDPMALLRNDSRRGNWLKIDLIGTTSNRRGVGARITVRQNDLTLVQQIAGGGSYCAASQPTAIFGVGKSDARCTVEVRWPSGIVQTLDRVPLNGSLAMTEPAK